MRVRSFSVVVAAVALVVVSGCAEIPETPESGAKGESPSA
jgi:hypothetical protein